MSWLTFTESLQAARDRQHRELFERERAPAAERRRTTSGFEDYERLHEMIEDLFYTGLLAGYRAERPDGPLRGEVVPSEVQRGRARLPARRGKE